LLHQSAVEPLFALDHHEPFGRQPGSEQRAGDAAGAAAELDDEARLTDVDLPRHRAGEEPARRRQRSDPVRRLQPAAEEKPQLRVDHARSNFPLARRVMS